jgi:hypothetical protein
MRSLGLALLCLLATSNAPAATAIRASIEQLAAEAAFTEDRSPIETRVGFSVLEVIAGTVGTDLTVLCAGGRVGDCALRVRGQPTFSPDEEAVLFLRRDSHGDWRVLGWSQGKFRIVRDPERGTATAIQDLTGLCFVGPAEGAPVARGPERLPLDDLTSRVLAARTPVTAPPGEKGEGGAPPAETGPPNSPGGTSSGESETPPTGESSATGK